MAAMRFGSDPSIVRHPDDLGRFGLGLKTASLSQARVLSVITKESGQACSIARWDLDAIEAADDWDLLVGPQADLSEIEEAVGRMSSGTVVIWDNLDILLGTANSIDNFYEIAERVSRHLAVTFHRFIESNTVQISINGAKVPSINPVVRSHTPTVISERRIPTGHDDAIVVQGLVLPVGAIRIEDEISEAAAVSIEQQGFYVYRNDRLISAGGWLGLGKSERPWRIDRAHSLARVVVDLRNSDDLIWGIDLRKSQAKPPANLVGDLRSFAELIRRRAAAAIRAGTPAIEASRTRDDSTAIWVSGRKGLANAFRINRRHPLIRRVRGAMSDKTLLRTLLDRIEERSFLSAAPQSLPEKKIDAARTVVEDHVRRLARIVYSNYRRGNRLSPDQARTQILDQPEFREHSMLVLTVIGEVELGGSNGLGL